MTELQWRVCKTPHRLVQNLPKGVPPSRIHRLAIALCQLGTAQLTEPSRMAVLVAEAWFDGRMSDTEKKRATLEAENEYARLYRSHAMGMIDGQPGLELRGAHAAHSVCDCDERSEHFALGSALGFASECQPDHVSVAIIREVLGNPFRPVSFDPAWRTDTVLSLAQGMYESRDFSAMPILADALQDAGCDNADILNHCRDEKSVGEQGANAPRTPHVRGCWVVDLVLGKS